MRHIALISLALLACGPDRSGACDSDNAGLTLPAGFCAQVMAEGLGSPRHMAVASNGDVFVAVPSGRNRSGTPGVWALRDTTGDGRADVAVQVLAVDTAQDVELVEAAEGGWLYYSTNSAVWRHPWTPGELAVGAQGQAIVSGMTDRGQHAAKTFVLADDGMLYVNIGAPANACQVEMRTPRSPGQDPCPLLDISGGIWRFDAGRPGQTQEDGVRFATGMRNMVALALQPETGALWGLQHGRDDLARLWGFSDSASANLPAEELFHITEGDDFGWPYCHYDGLANVKVLAPEYGGDGTRVGRCAEVKGPATAFPAHWAPNGLTFHDGQTFPTEYRGGAFIAFHGSWNRAPFEQEGFNVVFLPFVNGAPGDWRVFADGFRPDARPVDIAVAPDGSLLVTDDRGGRLYRIRRQD